jgi:fatty acid desaturase
VWIRAAAFRQLRAKLVNDGWFERSAMNEIALVTPILGMAAAGTYLSYSHPITAIVLIAVAMQQAGWLGHDMTHSKESVYCEHMCNIMSAAINGFNRTWWSTKHNTHHVMTNHVGVDPDIDLMPALFLWSPSKGLDSHMRRYQHLYAVPLYSLLYVSWRQQSIQRAVFDRDYPTLAKLAVGYMWLATMPLFVSFCSIILGGLLVAAVVTQVSPSSSSCACLF